MALEKRCSKCRKVKPVEEFNRLSAPHSKDGYHHRCRECNKALRNDLYANNPDYRNKITTHQSERYNSDEEYREKNIDQVMFNKAERLGATTVDRTVTKRAVFDKFGGKCQICGRATQLGGQKPWSASLDHIVGISKGGQHTWNNVQLLCVSCNTRKG